MSDERQTLVPLGAVISGDDGPIADVIFEPRCVWCKHYRIKNVASEGQWLPFFSCALDRPLIPCKFYEREPGADDE